MQNEAFRIRTGKFAVTGGIGSGKSAFCACLRRLGYPVFSCDDISRELWESAEYRRGLALRFPQCTEGGEIRKNLLTSVVFRDERLLAELNAYAHPLIMKRLSEQTDREPLSFSEVPLLFEGGYERLFDGVIVVIRDRAAREKGVLERDGADSDVLSRMARQMNYDALDYSNYVVVQNDGTEEELFGKAVDALKQLKLF